MNMKTNSTNNTCILCFIKYPEPGRVKSRLAAYLGEQQAAELYHNCVADILSTLEKNNFVFRLCYHPPEAEKKIANLLGAQYHYYPQQGTNLGERLINSFEYAFKNNFQYVIAIGSDSPDIPAGLLTEAFSALHSHDCVIGPTADGGYYLIGFTPATFLPGAFTGINWSTPVVFQQTMAALSKKKYSVYVLRRWHDIDTYDDLKDFTHRNQTTEFRHSKTFLYVCRSDLLKK